MKIIIDVYVNGTKADSLRVDTKNLHANPQTIRVDISTITTIRKGTYTP